MYYMFVNILILVALVIAAFMVRIAGYVRQFVRNLVMKNYVAMEHACMRTTMWATYVSVIRAGLRIK